MASLFVGLEMFGGRGKGVRRAVGWCVVGMELLPECNQVWNEIKPHLETDPNTFHSKYRSYLMANSNVWGKGNCQTVR